MAETPEVAVEVAFAAAGEVRCLSTRLPRGATVADALAACGLRERHPEVLGGDVALGIFGQRVGEETIVENGDRIEIYGAIRCDPKEMRRQRAADQREVDS